MPYFKKSPQQSTKYPIPQNNRMLYSSQDENVKNAERLNHDQNCPAVSSTVSSAYNEFPPEFNCVIPSPLPNTVFAPIYIGKVESLTVNINNPPPPTLPSKTKSNDVNATEAELLSEIAIANEEKSAILNRLKTSRQQSNEEMRRQIDVIIAMMEKKQKSSEKKKMQMAQKEEYDDRRLMRDEYSSWLPQAPSNIVIGIHNLNTTGNEIKQNDSPSSLVTLVVAGDPLYEPTAEELISVATEEEKEMLKERWRATKNGEI